MPAPTFTTTGLIAGQPQNVAEIKTALDELKSILSGNLDSANIGSALQALFVQPGTLAMTAATTADTGWLLCDGSAVSRTTYASLFARIGTLHGTGNGTTTFNLPDLRGKAPVGANNVSLPNGRNSALSIRNVADTGGEESHALSVGELASHNHTGSGTTNSENSSLAHAHLMQQPVPGRTGGSAWGNAAATVGGTSQYAASFGATIADMNGTSTNGPSAHTHDFTATIGSTGSGTAHNNMQPYAAVNFQIKT